jgi:hypothetical protein
VREADDATLIVANGFSCREQIEQGCGRHTRHIADVLAQAIDLDRQDEARPAARTSRGLLLAGGLLAAGVIAGVVMAARPAYGKRTHTSGT